MNEINQSDDFGTGEEKDVLATGVNFDRVWFGISAGLWASEPGAIERVATRLLRSRALAKVLVATPSLFMAWLLASGVIFLIGAVMTRSTGQPLIPVLAPAVAGIGVSLAYGSAADPAWDITRTVAVPSRLMLLLRVVVVFFTNTLIGLVATVFTQQYSEITVLWLVPMTAISLLGLALAIALDSAAAGSIASLAVWFGFVGRTFLERRTLGDVITSEQIAMALPAYAAMICLSLFAIWFVASESGRRGFPR